MGAFAIGRAFVAAQRMGQVESARVDLHRIPIMVDRDGDGPSGAAPARSHAPLCVLLLRAYEMCDVDIVREFFALMRFARRRTLAHGVSNLRKHTAVSTSVASGGFFLCPDFYSRLKPAQCSASGGGGHTTPEREKPPADCVRI